MEAVKTDDRGIEYLENVNLDALPPGWALCETCHRAWNDEKSTAWTPTPAGRCPFEYEHDSSDALEESAARDDRRRELAIEIAQRQATDDLEVPGDMDVPIIESVDGGYWIAARIWVDADEVEDELNRATC